MISTTTWIEIRVRVIVRIGFGHDQRNGEDDAEQEPRGEPMIGERRSAHRQNADLTAANAFGHRDVRRSRIDGHEREADKTAP